jgi:hypothetical protein
MRFLKLRYAVIAVPLIAALAGAGTWLAKTMSSTPVTLPAGTSIQVAIDHTLSSDLSNTGDRFMATVTAPETTDGKTVIPEGARVEGVVDDARASGFLKGVARLSLALETITVDGKPYDVHTGDTERQGRNHKKHNWEYIGGGAGGGALIGALAAGGKGALIGGPVGAGAGLAVAAVTGKRNITIPAETVLVFELSDPVSIKVKR